MQIRKGISQGPFQYLTQIFKLLLLGGMFLLLFYAFNQMKSRAYFPIKTVRVFGINKVDQRDVETLVLPLVKRGFFTINVDSIKDRLFQMPWVANIFVRRSWPDQVDITIIEKIPLARWNADSVLSDNGEIFLPSKATFPTHIPQLIGPNGQQMTMLYYFNQINRLLTPLHARISYLELSPYLSWKLMLDNGITLKMGHKDVLDRLHHFIKVYPKVIGNREGDVDYIDLRYPNGMAVKWKGMA